MYYTCRIYVCVYVSFLNNLINVHAASPGFEFVLLKSSAEQFHDSQLNIKGKLGRERANGANMRTLGRPKVNQLMNIFMN